MKLLGSTKNKDKNGENVPHLEITEVILVPVTNITIDIVNNDYQYGSKALYTFVRNKPFGSLLEISLINHIFFKNI